MNNYNRKTVFDKKLKYMGEKETYYYPESVVCKARAATISRSERFEIPKQHRGYAVYVGPGSYSPRRKHITGPHF